MTKIENASNTSQSNYSHVLKSSPAATAKNILWRLPQFLSFMPLIPNALLGLLRIFFPRSLYGRTIFILVFPMLILQFTLGFIFYGSHWNTITNTIAIGIAGKVHRLVDTLQAAPERLPQIINEATLYDGLNISFEPGAFLRKDGDTLSFSEGLSSEFNLRNTSLVDNLSFALHTRIKRPFTIDFLPENNGLNIGIQLAEGVFTCLIFPDQLLGTTVYVFLLWMFGASLILFAAAALFLIYQIRPIGALAHAVDLFGRGVEEVSLPNEGALEIKRASQAFEKMRRRILSQLRQRSDMLLAVSHDLRTPLTRIRLEAAMAGEQMTPSSRGAINDDIKDMEHMIESYLAFAKGEGQEISVQYDIQKLTEETILPWQRSGVDIDLHHENHTMLWLKPLAMKRCLSNIIGNAIKHAKRIRVNVGKRNDHFVITVDDDGPGIPLKERQRVFRPFYRVDSARSNLPGSGLGLSIALDIATAHGGQISIEDSPLGGARILIVLPI